MLANILRVSRSREAGRIFNYIEASPKAEYDVFNYAMSRNWRVLSGDEQGDKVVYKTEQVNQHFKNGWELPQADVQGIPYPGSFYPIPDSDLHKFKDHALKYLSHDELVDRATYDLD